MSTETIGIVAWVGHSLFEGWFFLVYKYSIASRLAEGIDYDNHA